MSFLSRANLATYQILLTILISLASCQAPASKSPAAQGKKNNANAQSAAQLSAPAPAPAPKPKPALTKNGVVRVKGKLGLPVGTLMIIEGVALDNRKNANEVGGDDMLLEILKVNFKPLPKPVIMPPFLGMHSHTLHPEFGKRFALVGYETGNYRGVPFEAAEWANGRVGGMSFQSYFQILDESDGLPLNFGK